ncbi:hypothetical protein KBC25_02695 [Candidatus Pacearchaeota archaeon]|jgi:hypothetical protein|nr:hypothetical protein [Candidatus Pacearchaeota archaeon]
MQKIKTKANKEDYLDKVKNPRLKEMALILESKGIMKVKKINSETDAEEIIKQEMKDSLQNKIQDLNETFSELRKRGIDLSIFNFKLVILPLKLKVFLATYEKKDLENILNRIDEIDKEIKKYK